MLIVINVKGFKSDFKNLKRTARKEIPTNLEFEDFEINFKHITGEERTWKIIKVIPQVL